MMRSNRELVYQWLLLCLVIIAMGAETGTKDFCMVRARNGKIEKVGSCERCQDEGWTSWSNRDHPSGKCDCETRVLANIGPCENPIDIEVRLADGRPYTEGGDVVLMLPHYGFVCFNRWQPAGVMCKDYMVRYCCPKD